MMAGVGTFSCSLRGWKLVPLKWRYLLPPISPHQGATRWVTQAVGPLSQKEQIDMWSNSSKVTVIISMTNFILALQSCASLVIQPTASPVLLTLDNLTQVFSMHPTPPVETPACTEKTVPPIIADVQPSPALPGSEITIIGTGGYIQDSCGGINESARSYKLYLDDELVGDLLCYVNRCETIITLAGSIASKSHCLSTQKGVCEFQLQVGSE